jgi:hypothetical protein
MLDSPSESFAKEVSSSSPVKSTSRPNCNKVFLHKKEQNLDYWGKKTKFSCNKANCCVVCNLERCVLATSGLLSLQLPGKQYVWLQTWEKKSVWLQPGKVCACNSWNDGFCNYNWLLSVSNLNRCVIATSGWLWLHLPHNLRPIWMKMCGCNC